MADPISMVAVGSMAASAAGGIVSGLGAEQSAEANAQAYRYKAGVAQLNKQINKQNAAWALQSGDIQAMESGMKAGQQIAETKVIQAASNLDVNSGSAAAVRDTQTTVAAFDQNVIRWDASKTAYGYETKAVTDEAETNLDKMAASQSEEAGKYAMWSSFLGGASSVSSKWMQGSQAGAFG